jgi:hypothetical protein
MEYLTLLNYLYVITNTSRKRATTAVSFFLQQHLTALSNLVKLNHHPASH